MTFDPDTIYARERAIAQREGIAWKRIDRSWVRGQALKELRDERSKEQL